MRSPRSSPATPRAGHRRVKIKIGREPERDVDRVRVAREAIGPASS